MRPARISIQGNYWDTQIYRGRLYLFTIEGSIKIIDWNRLIDHLCNDQYTNIAFQYAFKDGRYLYHPSLTNLFKDADIKQVLQNKFLSLGDRSLTITQQELIKFQIKEQDTPFEELHSDSEVLSGRLFSLTHNSLLSADINVDSKRFPISFATKHFDLYGFTIRANEYARIAISAGSDGLMEYNAASTNPLDETDKRRMKIISTKHSSFADYSFISIYSSSNSEESFLSYYVWQDQLDNDDPKEKEFAALFTEDTIFEKSQDKTSYLSWGANEKIYRAVESGIEVVKFNNYAKANQNTFSDFKLIPLKQWKGRVLSAFIAYFGTVLHCENAVVVMLSDGSFYNIPGDISRIRIFPRSLNYENHLHIIYNDYLELYSFNNDYFVEQKTKDFGYAFNRAKYYRNYPKSTTNKRTKEPNKSVDTEEDSNDPLPF